MRTGRGRFVAAGMAVLVGAVVACRSVNPRDPVGRPWRRIPGAFAAPPGAVASATLLMPAPNGCFSAVGPVDAGPRRYTGVWQATGACDSVRREWPVEVPPSSDQVIERETVVDVVDRDGTWLTVFAVDAGARMWGEVARGAPGQWVAGRLREPPDGEGDVPTAVGLVGANFIAVGTHGNRPTAYWSAGGPWHDQPLPVPAGGSARPLSVAGAPTVTRPRVDGSVVNEFGPGVIVGRTGSGAAIWSTADGGTKWAVQEFPEAVELTDVTYDGSGFVAVGAGRDGSAVVLVSANGASWRADRRAIPAGARPLRTVQALRRPADPQLVIGGRRRHRPRSSRSAQQARPTGNAQPCGAAIRMPGCRSRSAATVNRARCSNWPTVGSPRSAEQPCGYADR